MGATATTATAASTTADATTSPSSSFQFLRLHFAINHKKPALFVISAGKKRSNNIIKYHTMHITRGKSKESMTRQ